MKYKSKVLNVKSEVGSVKSTVRRGKFEIPGNEDLEVIVESGKQVRGVYWEVRSTCNLSLPSSCFQLLTFKGDIY